MSIERLRARSGTEGGDDREDQNESRHNENFVENIS